MTFDDLKKIITQKNLSVDMDVITLAYTYAEEAHKGQKRMSGEPYIVHPLATAVKLAELGLDTDTIAAGLLHDVPEDTEKAIQDIKQMFGNDIAALVDGITKLGKIKYRGIDRFAESLRKMFVAMAQDIRVIFIKFADRAHNLQTLDALPQVKQQRIARETIEIYAPIASRLGMGAFKGLLEDLAFPYAYPEKYEWLMKTTKQTITERLKILKDATKRVDAKLKETGIAHYELNGRAKHNFSLYKKLLRKDKDIERVYDLVALRIVVVDIKECYQAVGLIHQMWKPIPQRFKDYIAQPKPNGYQSLHTDVFTSHGHPVEFQIRTREMHEIAEFGVAAHFHYKEGGKKHAPHITGEGALWLKQLQQIQDDITENPQFLETIKLDVFSHRIFVFTPKGDVVDLPEGSTTIDFAYHIHSDIGDHCAGAKVNGKLTALTEPLKNGDVVEIITDKKRTSPSKDWLDFVHTHTAKSKIKSAIRKRHMGIIDQLLNR